MGEKNEVGLTPLLIAASKGHAEEVELLLVDGSQVEDRDPVRGWTPLHFAAVYGHVRIIQLLLLHGTDVNSRSRTGATPIHYAAMHNHSEVVKILIEQGGCRPDVSYSALQKLIIS